MQKQTNKKHEILPPTATYESSLRLMGVLELVCVCVLCMCEIKMPGHPLQCYSVLSDSTGLAVQ